MQEGGGTGVQQGLQEGGAPGGGSTGCWRAAAQVLEGGGTGGGMGCKRGAARGLQGMPLPSSQLADLLNLDWVDGDLNPTLYVVCMDGCRDKGYVTKSCGMAGYSPGELFGVSEHALIGGG